MPDVSRDVGSTLRRISGQSLPVSRGGAVSQTRLRTTILHNHAGHCKRSLRCLAAPNSGIKPVAASRFRSGKTVSNEKKNAAQSIGSSALYALNDLDERLAGSKPLGEIKRFGARQD
jgi:hypothetical protein